MLAAQIDAPGCKPSGSYGEGEAKRSASQILIHEDSSIRGAPSARHKMSRLSEHRTGSLLKSRCAACPVLTCADLGDQAGINHGANANPRALRGRLAEVGQGGAASQCPDLTECRSWLGPPLVPAHQLGRCAFPVGQRKEPQRQAQLLPTLSNCGNPSCSPGLT